MTTNHHTPITIGAPRNAATINGPLGQLDEKITNQETQIETLENHLWDVADQITVSAGVLTVTKSRHKVQPQSGTADDIDAINGMDDHTLLVLFASDFGTDTLTFKHGTGNLSCFGGNDIELSHGFVLCYRDGVTVYISGGGGGALDITQIPVQGGMINGKIVTSVTSNNLTVAIKTLAGNDPSAGDPVYIRIGNTVRTLVSALSITKNAATNWCNAGSSEIATKEVDYFVYIGFNTTDGVVIGFSRIPYARVYGDFSTVSTDEKYAAISTITNANGADEYEVVGRFNAVLSAGAGYTWSIPVTSIVISRPIYSTRWLSWQPSYGGSGSMTFASVTTTQATYKIENDKITINIDVNGTTGGTASFGINISAPLKMNLTKMPGIPYLPCYIVDSTKPGGYLRYAQSSYDGVQAERLDETSWGLGSGRIVRGSLIYAI